MISLIATQLLETPETTKPREPVVLRCVKPCWVSSPLDGYDRCVLTKGQKLMLSCDGAKAIVLEWMEQGYIPRNLVVVSGYP